MPKTKGPCGKLKLPTKDDARESKKQVMAHGFGKMRIYWCLECLAYHLTTIRPSKRQQAWREEDGDQ